MQKTLINVRKNLRERFRKAERTAILGVGSELMGDDGAGMLAAQKIHERLNKLFTDKRAKVFFGATTPENLTGEIRNYNPTHVIIIDSADLGEKLGSITLLSPEQENCASCSTHRLPLKLLTNYLHNSLRCESTIIAIQPEMLGFDVPPSKCICDACEHLAEILADILKNPCG